MLAAILLALSVTISIAAVVTAVRHDPGADAQVPLRVAELLVWGSAGAFLLARRPDLSFGWIFAVGASVEVLYLGIGLPALIAEPSTSARLTSSIAGIQWAPDLLLGLIFCRFPTGRPSGPGWARLDCTIRWGAVVMAPLGLLEQGTSAGSSLHALVEPTMILLPLLILLGAIAGVSLILRWRRARGIRRRQLAWMAAGAAIHLIGWPVVVSGLVPEWSTALLTPVVPVALLVPIRRHHLWAIDAIMRRSAVHHLAAGGRTIDGVVNATAELLHLPYVAVRRGETLMASYGEEPATTENWPLVHDGAQIGRLVAAPRFGHTDIAPEDRTVLASVAQLVTGSVQALSLNQDLQTARQRLVSAREEERRRLRRDLHDGLGPMLTGLGLNLDAARADPARSQEYLSHAKDTSTEAIRSLREVVHGLRPPALDDLGFAGALKLQVARVAGDLDVNLDIPDSLQLPAAIEVAALRTTVEAINNAVKHSAATAVTVTVTTGRQLRLVVTDNAGGHTQPWHPGVGLSSMRTRAEELGGTFTAEPTPAGGRIVATYPLGPLERT